MNIQTRPENLPSDHLSDYIDLRFLKDFSSDRNLLQWEARYNTRLMASRCRELWISALQVQLLDSVSPHRSRRDLARYEKFLKSVVDRIQNFEPAFVITNDMFVKNSSVQ